MIEHRLAKMKDPSQSEDLRFVSAYSVYKGLAPGLKVYQDTSSSQKPNAKKRNKKKRKQAAKTEDVKDKSRTSSAEKAVNGGASLNQQKTAPNKTPAPASTATTSSSSIQINGQQEPGKAKKKRKKNKKKSGNKTTDDTNSSTRANGIAVEDGPSEDEEPPAKSMKMKNVVANPFAVGPKPGKNKSMEVKKSPAKGDDAKSKKKKNANATATAIAPGPSPSVKSTAKSQNGLPISKSKKKDQSSSMTPGPSNAVALRGNSARDYIIESEVPPPDIKKLFDKNRIEDSVDHGKKVLEWLIHPVSVDEFMRKYWEKKPLLIKRKNEESRDYYKWILTTQIFDDVLRRNVIKYGLNLDVTSYENGVRETLSENLTGRVRPAVVWDYYNNGCSVRMLNPQTYVQPLWRVNASLQEWFGSFVGANVYLTPPNSQGFAPHYDDIEAFILQVEGKKQWKVYRPRENEDLARFSSPNFNEEKDNIGSPVIDVVLEEGDLLYFPRGWIHQAKTVEGEHSFHITISCHQLNSFGDLLKHHVNHALDKLMATDVSFRQGLPTDYLSYMGIAHENTEDSELIKKRKEFSKKVHDLVSKLAKESPDFAADAMGKKFIWDSLPPFYTGKERQTTVVDGGEFMTEGRVFNRVEFGPEVEVKLARKNCVRLVVEEGTLKLYYSSENPLVYHEQEAQFLEIGLEFAPAVNHLISQYPEYTKIEDLPLASDDIGQKIQIVGDLWERGLILTKGPLEPCDDDMGPEGDYEEDDDDEDVESINLSDLPREGDSSDDDSESDDDEFYDTTMGYDLEEDSDDEFLSSEEEEEGDSNDDGDYRVIRGVRDDDDESGEEEEDEDDEDILMWGEGDYEVGDDYDDDDDDSE